MTSVDGLTASRVRKLLPPGRSVYRCNGTPSEVETYREAFEADGWNVPDRRTPVTGDLLLGVATRRRPLRVIDDCRVEAVHRGRGREWLEWDLESDVPFLPSISLTEVEDAMGFAVRRGWTRLDGSAARAFVDSLARTATRALVGYDEGAERAGTCRIGRVASVR